MEISNLFGPDGVLAGSLDDYEYRPEQLKMAEAVAASIDSAQNLVVEAGTGTGKTLAYLVPAILSRRQVVVSTGTKNLQEQIFFKDIPFLRKHLGVKFSAVMMKGRSNYLCPLRMQKFTQRPIFRDGREAKMLDEIFRWMKVTKTGDRSELADLPEDSQLWNQICSNPDFCGSQKCPRATECYIGALRKEAEASQIIVVNHHLFFADLAIRGRSGNGVLPDYEVAIFDEAHQVEEIASNYFGFSVSNFRFEELVRDAVRELDQSPLSPAEKQEFTRDLDNLDTRSKSFFHAFETERERRFGLANIDMEPEAADILVSSLSAIEEKFSGLEALTDEIRNIAHRFRTIAEDLKAILKMDDKEYIFWGEVRGRGIFLNASSIEVSDIMKGHLYSKSISVFTSATLASAGDFSYIVSRLGLEDAETIALATPFDYASQAKVYLPDMPDPNSKEFLEALADESLRLIKLVKGRTLFLFTSFKNMRETRKRLHGKMEYTVLMQGDAPKHLLLEEFKLDVGSVLFATSSFWQGVDVRGEALSCVIIDRLPFASPGDPIMAARIDRVREKGGNPFIDYQVPYAVLALKQGLGRLIRHRNDKGIMMIADNRMVTKSYGKSFIDSLPPAPLVRNFESLDWK